MASVRTGSFRTRLLRLLKDNFPGAEFNIQRSGPLERFAGVMVWGGFEGFEQIERQERLWKVLRSHLSPDDERKVAAILTMTPAER